VIEVDEAFATRGLSARRAELFSHKTKPAQATCGQILSGVRLQYSLILQMFKLILIIPNKNKALR
jgi:hypothetical protein